MAGRSIKTIQIALVVLAGVSTVAFAGDEVDDLVLGPYRMDVDYLSPEPQVVGMPEVAAEAPAPASDQSDLLGAVQTATHSEKIVQDMNAGSLMTYSCSVDSYSGAMLQPIPEIGVNSTGPAISGFGGHCISAESDAQILALQAFVADRASSCTALQDFRAYNDFMNAHLDEIKQAHARIDQFFDAVYGKKGIENEADWSAALYMRMQLQSIDAKKRGYDPCAEASSLVRQSLSVPRGQLSSFARSFRLAGIHGLPICGR